mmetsp:Transcript_69164/g.162729  ORF Transcript_69164/g.162729 Transcript_69164/m.162729 type:complete len:411 (-) Transcript_69164:84-1316(-)
MSGRNKTKGGDELTAYTNQASHDIVASVQDVGDGSYHITSLPLRRHDQARLHAYTELLSHRAMLVDGIIVRNCYSLGCWRLMSTSVDFQRVDNVPPISVDYTPFSKLSLGHADMVHSMIEDRPPHERPPNPSNAPPCPPGNPGYFWKGRWCPYLGSGAPCAEVDYTLRMDEAMVALRNRSLFFVGDSQVEHLLCYLAGLVFFSEELGGLALEDHCTAVPRVQSSRGGNGPFRKLQYWSVRGAGNYMNEGMMMANYLKESPQGLPPCARRLETGGERCDVMILNAGMHDITSTSDSPVRFEERLTAFLSHLKVAHYSGAIDHIIFVPQLPIFQRIKGYPNILTNARLTLLNRIARRCVRAAGFVWLPVEGVVTRNKQLYQDHIHVGAEIAGLLLRRILAHIVPAYQNHNTT